MISSSRRLVPGCARMLRDAKEAFREAPRVSVGAPLRQASTGAERVAATGAASDGGGGRSKRQAGGGNVKRALGLKEFMHRARVLDLYRGILKRAREIEDKDVAAEARRQFKLSINETDPLKIQMLVADATNHLEAMQGSSRTGPGGGGGNNSWLDIHDPEDKRGRVGVGFPWQR